MSNYHLHAVTTRKNALNANFRRMVYFVTVNREAFKLDEFGETFGGDIRREKTVSAAPRDGAHGLYHVHATWRFRGESIEFRVEHIAGPMTHAANEREPYAEEFMKWLGHFFTESVKGHIHARFDYPAKKRRAIFVVPPVHGLSVPVEVTGTRFRLPSKPNGISSLTITELSSRWAVDVIANFDDVFKAFDLQSDLQQLQSTIDLFIEEVRS